ncbi:hypothetical protein GXP67_16575 [Rhodocytophaga rosea]|uniref:Uncharacterized protein n=1 Tax=Rhodocytophaga rosea TaxID=2704465 RepID=A0A6C0GKH5_9BACT|nr:hypothetical protein [Rhodocytophaga rosea]QHT68140.1 hypothetical protein GXP67_16575 [Rhodocytophaga rosea]
MPDSNTYFNDTNPTVFSAAELVAIFRQSGEKIATLHVYSYEDFSALSQHIREYYRQANTIVDTISRWLTSDLSPEKNIAAQAEKSLKNISSIVTKLQFHDIIRQKLEHIQQTNESIIEELLTVSRQHVRSQAREIYRYLSIVPDIARLHIAQLTHTNKEYQHAFADIKADLQSILDQTITVSQAYTEFNSSANQDASQHLQNLRLTDKFCSDINKALEQIKNCEAFEKRIEEINENLSILLPHAASSKDNSASTENKMIAHLRNLYTMESERIIHEQVLGKDPVTGTSSPESDDNLELF